MFVCVWVRVAGWSAWVRMFGYVCVCLRMYYVSGYACVRARVCVCARARAFVCDDDKASKHLGNYYGSTPWCQGMLTASLKGVLVRRFHVGWPAISGPRICSRRLRSRSLLHRARKDYQKNKLIIILGFFPTVTLQRFICFWWCVRNEDNIQLVFWCI